MFRCVRACAWKPSKQTKLTEAQARRRSRIPPSVSSHSLGSSIPRAHNTFSPLPNTPKTIGCEAAAVARSRARLSPLYAGVSLLRISRRALTHITVYRRSRSCYYQGVACWSSSGPSGPDRPTRPSIASQFKTSSSADHTARSTLPPGPICQHGRPAACRQHGRSRWPKP